MIKYCQELGVQAITSAGYVDGSNGSLLQVKDIWDSIRERQTKVAWQKLIWYPLHLPRHSLILWMAW